MSKKVFDCEDLIEKAAAFAKRVHAGQTDKSGVDYFEGHISTVAAIARENCSGEAVIAAYLHDTIEDTDTTREELAREFPEAVVNAVALLSKPDGEDYIEYVKRVRKDPIAKQVKMCDLAHNMDLKRLRTVTQADIDRVLKYAAAYAELMKPEIHE